jgi:NitT/TauT family transport system permease protein
VEERPSLIAPVATAIVVVAAWWFLVPLLGINPRYLPSLSTVVADGLSIRSDLVAGFWRTFVETALGFLVGSLIGFAVGVVFAYIPILERAFLPILVAAQTIPVIAFGAIVVIWFGNTILAKVVIAFYLSFFPVTVATIRGLETVDRDRENLMRSFGASGRQIFLKLALPTALPLIMVGLKIGVSFSLAGAIVGEFFGDTVGLGVLLIQALYFEQVPRIWVLIVACAILGTIPYALLVLVERRWVWWRAE